MIVLVTYFYFFFEMLQNFNVIENYVFIFLENLGKIWLICSLLAQKRCQILFLLNWSLLFTQKIMGGEREEFRSRKKRPKSKYYQKSEIIRI